MDGRRIGIACGLLSILVPLTHGQTTMRVSVDSFGAEANALSDWLAISADGNLIAFTSYADNLVPGDTNGLPDLFLRDRNAGTTRRLSLGEGDVELNGWVGATAISADGRFAAIDTIADNALTGDVNGHEDVFVVDVLSGVLVLASVDSFGMQGDGASGLPALSGDGRYVAFVSDATNLVSGDANATRDVFVRDLLAGTTERVSINSSGVEANGYSDSPSISGDGRFVAFHSLATNLDANDANGAFDIYVHDRATGTTTCASVDGAGAPGNGNSSWLSVSADGRLVAFDSDTSNLVANDGNGVRDVFVRDLVAGTTALVSVDGTGQQGDADSAEHLALSGDGTKVAFLSWATNLVPGDANGQPDVFLRDLVTGTTTRVSFADDGTEANGASRRCALSADGTSITYTSVATNLVAGDTNAADDVFVFQDACGTDASWSNYGSGYSGTNGVPPLTAQNDPALGTTLYVHVGSSAPAWTLAYLLVGTEQAAIPMRKGGELLVIPNLALVLVLPPKGTTVAADIEDDEALCGLEVFAQTLLLDPGAANGQAASAGLKLVLGH